jgi:hypothetical protein
VNLLQLLDRERRYLARLLNASGVTLLLGAIALLLAVGTLLLGGARWLAMPRMAPFVFWLGAVVVVAAGVRVAMRLRTRFVTLPGVAMEVERERALRDGSIRGTLEVADSGTLGRLGAESMARRLASFGDVPLAPGLRRRLVRWLGAGAVATAASLAILVAGTAVAPDGWAALLHPVRAWNGTLLEGVRLEPVPSSVMRGERVAVAVRAPGRQRVIVAHRRTGSTWREIEVPVTAGRAEVRLDPLDADLSIYATDGRAISDTASVTMVERPFIGEVKVRATFPGYLARPAEEIVPGELMRVPQGTLLTVEGSSSMSLASVTLTRGTATVNLDVNGLRFSGRVPTVTGEYRWSATGVSGPITDVPLPLELEVLPDSAPRVEILSPGGDTTFTAGDSVTLSFMAADDHGIARLTMRTWIVSGRGARTELPDRTFPASNEGEVSGSAAVSPELRPGEALHVVVTATDGSPWQLTGESRELIIRLPTLSDQREAVRDAADSAVARATAAAEAQRQLQQRTEQASRERSQGDMTFESAERARSLAKEQRQLADRMEQLQETAQQLERQLAEAGALDSALQQQLEEAQKLLRDALTPELAEQLRKLEEASQNLSQQEARQAMADLAQQQQRLREMLDKSVEMLKRAALEGSMSTLTDEAKELAQRQRQIADSLARADDQESRRNAQQNAQELANRTRDLTDDVNALKQRLQQEKAETGAERVAEAERRMRESADALERASRNEQADSAQRAGTQADSGQQQRQQAGQQGQQQGQQQQGRQGQQQQGQQGQQQGRQGQQQQGRQGQQQQGQQGQQQGRQGQQQQGQQQQGQQGQQGGQRGEQSVEQAARQAADAMEQAARELADAREQQVGEWKQELTTELDRSIQEMIQLAREQEALEAQARRGASPEALRAGQGSLQQGVEQSASRLQEAAERSSLLSQRSLRTVNDARKRVEDATQQTRTATSPSRVASAMQEASEALNLAAASLVRDRERAETSNSASGFEEMLRQLQQMAQQQSSLNSAAQQLLPRMGTQLDGQGQQQSRQLARQQRDVAAQLDDVADRDDSGRADELAREARQIAALLEAAQVDPSTLERQQRLFRKMLDAGRLLEEDEREDTGKREARSWTGSEVFTPQDGAAAGRAGTRFQTPTWNDLRGLTPDERRLVLEYFRKINGQRP